jgi:hypothetical protein
MIYSSSQIFLSFNQKKAICLYNKNKKENNPKDHVYMENKSNLLRKNTFKLIHAFKALSQLKY